MRDTFPPSPIAPLVYIWFVPIDDLTPFRDGTYRIYNVSIVGETYNYTLSGRFEVQRGSVALHYDPTGLLTRYLAPGPLTLSKSYFLASMISGAYRYAIREEPEVAYLESYQVAVV